MDRYDWFHIIFAALILIVLLLSGCAPQVQAAPRPAPMQLAPIHVPSQNALQGIDIPDGVTVTISGGWLPDCARDDALCWNNAREGTASGHERLGNDVYRIYNESGETLYWLSWEEKK